MSKKIAVCISGQPRFLKLGYKYLKTNFLDLHDCDVFIHSWFDKSELEGSGYGGSFFLDENSGEEMISLYKPVSFIIEPQQDVGPNWDAVKSGDKKAAMTFAQYSMLYSALQANLLKKNHEKENDFVYDVVVRTRFDIALLKPIIVGDPPSKTVVGVDAIDNNRRLCDWFYYTDSGAMDFICESYNELDEYRKKLATFCGEEVLWDKISQLSYEVEKKLSGERGENLVLIRQNEVKNRCWKYYKHLPAIGEDENDNS